MVTNNYKIEEQQSLLDETDYKETYSESPNTKIFWTRNRRFAALLLLVIFIIFSNFFLDRWKDDLTLNFQKIISENNGSSIKNNYIPPGYLIYSDQCKLPDVDPFDPEIMKRFQIRKYEPCLGLETPTTIRFNSSINQYVLYTEKMSRPNKTEPKEDLNCCYKEILRSGIGKSADRNYKLGECISFSEFIQIPNSVEAILVNCTSKSNRTFLNAHIMAPERPDIRERLNKWKTTDEGRPVSVLIIGADSISRLNLARSMPKTAKHLRESENWFELRGYNKMDDNTFPNLMAIFTGFNLTTATSVCSPKTVGGLDKCPALWNTFRDKGYVTAYGEDETWMGTFNYLKVGFEKPPTDYYMRPFMMAAEKNLPIKKQSGMTFCVGYKHAAEYVYDFALDFANTYKNDPYFGLFWTNTFSHNSCDDPTSMDVKMLEYFEKFNNTGILDNSIVIFLSDHGSRWGLIRLLSSGWYEERLPFFWISIPTWLKEEYPEIVEALNTNRNRLTNPYDVHMTLQHILELSGRLNGSTVAKDCEKCESFLRPIPNDRSCEEVGIEDHWCTCIDYRIIPKDSNISIEVTNYTVDYMNKFLRNIENGFQCENLKVKEIVFMKEAHNMDNKSHMKGYQFMIRTTPGDGIFETTVLKDVTMDSLQISGSISRLNSYEKDSKCISNTEGKKYCFCKKKN